jgi:Ni/Co efflux regulator RcnB
MQRTTLQVCRTLTLIIAGALAAGPVLADKPTWVDGGKGGKHEQKRDEKGKKEKNRDHGKGPSSDRDRQAVRVHGYFQDQQRVVVRDYYSGQFRAGRCPPGLAKKHNGCMPPGQAKKWVIGRPLPRDVVYYDLPSSVVVQLGPPPSGYRYVRVASDILLIAVGTGMVMDAIQDLGR